MVSFHSKELMRLKLIAVIPTDFASFRFPGKVVFLIYGLPMIEHVWSRVLVSDEEKH